MNVLKLFRPGGATPAIDTPAPAQPAPSGRHKASTAKDTKGVFNQLRAGGSRCANNLLHRMSASPTKPQERATAEQFLSAHAPSSTQGVRGTTAITEKNKAVEGEIRRRIALLPQGREKESALKQLDSLMQMNEKRPKECGRLLAQLDGVVTPLAKRAQNMEAHRLKIVADANRWDIQPPVPDSLADHARFNAEVRTRIRKEIAEEKKRFKMTVTDRSGNAQEKETALIRYHRLRTMPMSAEQELNEYRALNQALTSGAFRPDPYAGKRAEAELQETKKSIYEYMTSLPRTEGQREELDAIITAYERLINTHSRDGVGTAGALRDFRRLKRQIDQGVFEPAQRPQPALPPSAGSVEKSRERYLLSVINEEFTYDHDGRDADGRDKYGEMLQNKKQAREELEQLRRRYAQRR
ncbi:hypothetical protein [Noviherbaspirillum sp.]|uniref:hypothetical protein n=1 Tax=Noviherbaspirillum sp. TaxID=1926288 RepID=UPI002FE13768